MTSSIVLVHLIFAEEFDLKEVSIATGYDLTEDFAGIAIGFDDKGLLEAALRARVTEREFTCASWHNRELLENLSLRRCRSHTRT